MGFETFFKSWIPSNLKTSHLISDLNFPKTPSRSKPPLTAEINFNGF